MITKKRFQFRFLILNLVALACAFQARAATPSFDGARAYPAIGGHLSGASAVATADFNGDGKLDMVATTPETDGVSLFLNNGDGTFAKATHIATDDTPNFVVVVDINRDGKLDLVTANGGGRSVSVL